MQNDTQSKRSLIEREAEFTEALKRWRSNNSDTEAWNVIFYRVHDCCHNIAAKMLKGVRMDPSKFDDRVMDSTLYTLERIKKGTDPAKLSSYCYLVVKGRLYGPKQQFEDKNMQYVPEIFPYLEEEAYYAERGL